MAGWDDLGFGMPMDARPDPLGRRDEMGRPLMVGIGGRVYSLPVPPAQPAPASEMSWGFASPLIGGPIPEGAYASQAPVNATGAAIGNALAGMVPGMLEGAWQGISAPGRALQSEPVTLGDVYATAGSAMGGGAVGAVPEGALAANSFRAYHGSPHQFDRFSLDAIGTGEGAQAYGHGLYFADSEDIARSYQAKVSAMHGSGEPLIDGRPIDWNNPLEAAAFAAARHGGDREAAAAFWETSMSRRSPVPAILRSQEALPDARMPGHLYEVQINADPANFLDWDAPLSAQPAPVRDPLLDFGVPDRPHVDGRAAYMHLVGDEIMAGRISPNPMNYAGHDIVSSRLRDAGIPGIRYLDAGSRTAGDGSRNTVVFDDAMIDILRRYGIATAAPVGGAAAGLSAQDRNALAAWLGGT